MTEAEARKSLAAGLLELCRPPNVFTAVADAAAGLVLVRGSNAWLPDPGLWCLAASACLYLGGMALNDYFDREIDAVERPERPIPSGTVPPLAAAALGGGLLAAGITFAGLAGDAPATLALLLALAILLYDAVLKETAAGFLNMGICRGLNLFLPMSLAVEPLPALARLAPLLLTAYVTALTYLSRDEVRGSSAARARRGVAGMAAVGSAVTLALALSVPPLAGWLFLAALLTFGTLLFSPLLREAGGPATGRAIGGGILLIPLFDATFVAAAGQALAAIVIAALLLPALALRRIYSPT